MRRGNFKERGKGGGRPIIVKYRDDILSKGHSAPSCHVGSLLYTECSLRYNVQVSHSSDVLTTDMVITGRAYSFFFGFIL